MALRNCPNLKIKCEDASLNKGATLIAKSVTKENRSQSYVAYSYHTWLEELFVAEGSITSL